MRISDWSSDVCSSDLGRKQARRRETRIEQVVAAREDVLDLRSAGVEKTEEPFEEVAHRLLLLELGWQEIELPLTTEDDLHGFDRGRPTAVAREDEAPPDIATRRGGAREGDPGRIRTEYQRGGKEGVI